MALIENYAQQRNDDLMRDNLTLDPKRNMKDALSLSQIAEGIPMYLNIAEDKRAEMYPKFAQSLIRDNPKMAAFVDPKKAPELSELHALQANLKQLGYSGSKLPTQNEGELDEGLIPADTEYNAQGDGPEDIQNPKHYVDTADTSGLFDVEEDDEGRYGKLSTGWRWVDPNNKSQGFEPIPGGPHDLERIRSEREEELEYLRRKKSQESEQASEALKEAKKEENKFGKDITKAGKAAVLEEALRQLQYVRTIVFNNDGSVNRTNVFSMDVPLVPSDKGLPVV